MGLGWVVASPSFSSTEIHEFACKINNFPSSTKAEALVIATALATCPPNTDITIKTDSKCVIDTFKYTQSRPSPRRYLKINNYLIWKAIDKIISSNRLNVTLEKVKAHSNDFFNDKADSLAKEGSSSNHVLAINPLGLNLESFSTWNLPDQLDKYNSSSLIIDRDIRKTLSSISNIKNINQFLAHHRLSYLQSITYNNKIDWKSTQSWFSYNPFDSPTSRKLTKFRSWQLKNCCDTLPTMDLMNKYYPNTFDNCLTCWHRKNTPETNIHL
ncbi:hypothetical protein RclHR1_14630005 [Rhizophagus clarus]|uniref:RNase H type-1 domain-containing protein n=1 Tax=Rhizophagus clarus TaxID=94130 RepID=A0A2Z6QD78_9GLOM|nr:hypothetical protein RclHR1_14630005 [Rhizophagus clarus]